MDATNKESNIQTIVDNFEIPYDKAKTIYESGMEKLQSDDETVKQDFVKEIQEELDIEEDDAGEILFLIETELNDVNDVPKEVKISTEEGNVDFIISKKRGSHCIKVISNGIENEITCFEPLDKPDTNRDKQLKFILSSYLPDFSKKEIDGAIRKFQQDVIGKYKKQIENLPSDEIDTFDKENDESDADGNIIVDGTIVENNHKKYCGLYVPDNYKIYHDKDSEKYGIYNNYDKHICSTPCLVTGKGINLDGGDNYYIITFTDYDEGKKQLIAKHSDMLTIKGVNGLIDKGIRVDNFTAGDSTKYFKESLDYNEGEMQKVNVVERNGWKKNNSIFAFGNKGFTENGILDIHQKSNTSHKLQSIGSFEEWKDGVEPVLNLRITRFKLYCAAAAFILDLIGVDNIIVYHWCGSSRGKTTTTQAAMSCLGNPNKEGLMNSGTTLVAAERIIFMYNDLPVIFDETTTESDNLLGILIYLIGNGITKSRGRKDGGVDEGFSFNTTGFFTGEKSVLNDDSYQGQWVRVIELNEELPQNEHYGNLMYNATMAMSDNYGFLAEPYIGKIFKHSKNELKAMHGEATKRILESNNGKDGFDRRVAQSFATIEVAGKMIEEVLGEHGFDAMNVEAIVDHYYTDKIKNHAIEEPYIVMLNHFMDWFSKKSNYFIRAKEPFTPSDTYGWESPDYIDVPKDILKMEALGAYDKGDLSSILKEWKTQGILKADKKGLTYSSSNGRVFRFVKSKINEVLDLNNENIDTDEIEIHYSEPKKLNLNFTV